MKFYFVRHGESEANKEVGMHGIYHQDAETKLSERGLEQADVLRNRLRKVEIDHILSSRYDRARKTAEIINESLQKPVEYLDILRETQMPSSLNGKKRDDPEVLHMWKLIHEHSDDPTWHYGDEENFFDRKERGKQTLGHLEKLEKENILVVSHNGVMKILFALMMFGKELTSREFYSVWRFMNMDNTGITICKYEREKHNWKLITWNDHAHLI